MLHQADKDYYKTPDNFYDWLSKLKNDELDNTIYKVADGRKFIRVIFIIVRIELLKLRYLMVI